MAIKKGCYGRRGYEPEDSNCTVTWQSKRGVRSAGVNYEPEDSNCTVTWQSQRGVTVGGVMSLKIVTVLSH